MHVDGSRIQKEKVDISYIHLYSSTSIGRYITNSQCDQLALSLTAKVGTTIRTSVRQYLSRKISELHNYHRYIFDIVDIHFMINKLDVVLAAVKTGYLLTSIARPYHGLRLRAHWGHVSFRLTADYFVTTFLIGLQAHIRLFHWGRKREYIQMQNLGTN